jgi:hypothetical protein
VHAFVTYCKVPAEISWMNTGKWNKTQSVSGSRIETAACRLRNNFSPFTETFSRKPFDYASFFCPY